MVERNDAHEHAAAQSRELYRARALLTRLVDWEDDVWAEARAFLKGEPTVGAREGDPALRPDELGD